MARCNRTALLHVELSCRYIKRCLPSPDTHAGWYGLCVPCALGLEQRYQASSRTQQAEPWSSHPLSHFFVPPIIASSLPSFSHSMQPL